MQRIVAGPLNTVIYISCRKKNKFVSLYTMNHNVTQLVEALGHKTEAAGSIPDGVIENFHSHNSSAVLWPWDRLQL